MAIQVVQLETDEWAKILDLLNAANKLRLRSEAGDYQGALPADSPQAKELRADLTVLVKAAKAVKPSTS